MIGTQDFGAEGVLDAVGQPEAHLPETACTTDADCPARASCVEADGVMCISDAVKDFIDHLAVSSQWLSCTGPDSYEDTWPSDRVIPLNTGGCSPWYGDQRPVYGYRAVNTLAVPAAFWVGKGPGDPQKRWWTLNPGEEIRFNVVGGALFFPTTVAAYHACSPSFMSRTVYTANLAAPDPPGQTNAVPLVRYAVSEQHGGGDFVVFRDKEQEKGFDLFGYPDYFGVGIPLLSTDGRGPVGEKGVSNRAGPHLQSSVAC